MSRQTSLKSMAAIAITVLSVSLMPLALLATFARPTADDFGYGTPVHFAVLSGDSVLAAIIENVRYSYLFWQGSFSSILMFSIQPGVINEEIYVITPFIMLFSIIFPIFYILMSLKTSDKSAALVIGCILSFFAIQFLPSPAQGLYWWNGAVYYVFFWGLAVTAAASLVKRINSSSFSVKFVVKSVFCTVSGIFIGGGNYPVALVFAIFLAVSLIFTFISGKKPYVKAAVLIQLLFTTTALMISLLAPGNTLRWEPERLVYFSVTQSLALSFKQTITDIVSFTADYRTFGIALFCIPFLLHATKNSKTGFQYPLLIIAGSFCALAAMYMPSYYAMGNSGPPRLKNIIWLTHIFWFFGNSFYVAGWVRNKARHARGKLKKIPVFLPVIIGFIIFTAGVATNFKSTTAYSAYTDVRNGLAAAYLEERAERVAVYKDKSIQAPRFRLLTRCPSCFYNNQLQTWSPDILIDGTPAELTVFRSTGGNTNFLELDAALESFGRPHASDISEYANIYYINGAPFIPIRELCGRLGFNITYDSKNDTISITTS